MITGGEPPHGDFIAYLEKIVGTPPSTPEEIIRLAREVSSGKASVRAGMVRPENSDGDALERPPGAKPVRRTVAIGDADLAVLAPIGRGLTLAGFAVIAAAVFLGPWLHLQMPSAAAGAAIVFLGVILRRIGRGALRTGLQELLARKP